MKPSIFNVPDCFITSRKGRAVSVIFVQQAAFKTWLAGQPRMVQTSIGQQGFDGQPEKGFVIRDAKGAATAIVVGRQKTLSLYDAGFAVQFIQKNFTAAFINSATFALKNVPGREAMTAALGWGLGCYQFNAYRKGLSALPRLVWPDDADRKRVKALLGAICTLKNMVNTPPNDMGPDALEKAVRDVAKTHTAQVKVIHDQALLTQNFPLIYAVGQGSDRRPRLIDLRWGKASHPKLTLIGKGVCFDTGGLNIKPGASMILMKKDMGGAAHALALARLVMDLKLPVRLRLLIPAVENSISGSAFRPSDIFTSRKGITVENTNTDAEGRLILADTLTYACEENPDLIIDFATLTGSARAGLGPDIPPVFSTNGELADKIKKISFDIEDPVWPMPLYAPYRKHNKSATADLHNSSGVPGDLMYSALFMQEFLTGNPDWMHFDTYAWEHTGRPGRPRGGADNGLRAAFALLESKYAK